MTWPLLFQRRSAAAPPRIPGHAVTDQYCSKLLAYGQQSRAIMPAPAFGTTT